VTQLSASWGSLFSSNSKDGRVCSSSSVPFESYSGRPLCVAGAMPGQYAAPAGGQYQAPYNAGQQQYPAPYNTGQQQGVPQQYAGGNTEYNTHGQATYRSTQPNTGTACPAQAGGYNAPYAQPSGMRSLSSMEFANFCCDVQPFPPSRENSRV